LKLLKPDDFIKVDNTVAEQAKLINNFRVSSNKQVEIFLCQSIGSANNKIHAKALKITQ
jgi:hypothetical protein